MVKRKRAYTRTKVNYTFKKKKLNEVTLPEVRGRGVRQQIIADIRKSLKDAAPQTCLEFDGVGEWMYHKVRKEIIAEFNVSYDRKTSLMFVWRGRDQNGG